MIYYFSGTGNSKWVAENIAKNTGDKVVNIAEYINKKDFSITVTSGEVLGIVFPIYAWSVPTFIIDFIKNINIEEGKKRRMEYFIKNINIEEGKKRRMECFTGFKCIFEI